MFLGCHTGDYNNDIPAVGRWVECHCMNENVLLTSSVELFVGDDIALWDGIPEASLMASLYVGLFQNKGRDRSSHLGAY